MQAGSNCALPNLALLDKRAQVTSSRKQETAFKLFLLFFFFFFNKDIAAMSLLNV